MKVKYREGCITIVVGRSSDGMETLTSYSSGKSSRDPVVGPGPGSTVLGTLASFDLRCVADMFENLGRWKAAGSVSLIVPPGDSTTYIARHLFVF
ncbi:hypothetical protein LB506_004109 [Fusarium annulatum]|nr:hypothetical protein LB506_004109 [Fusarium annulatum]